MTTREDYIRNRHLRLSTFEMIFHFSILLVPIIILFFIIHFWFSNTITSIPTFCFGLLIGISLLIGLFSLQKDRLKFKSIRIVSKGEKLKKVILNSLEKLEWKFENPCIDIYLVKVIGPLLEYVDVTVIIEDDNILINVKDNDSNITSFGKTKRTYNKFIETILREDKKLNSEQLIDEQRNAST